MPEEELPVHESITTATLEEAISQGLDEFELSTVKAAQALLAHPGKYSGGRIPDGYKSDVDEETLQRLSTGQYDLGLLSRYVGLYDRAQNVRQSFDPLLVPDRIQAVGFSVDPKLLQTAFNAEPPGGTIHEVVLKNTWQLNEAKDVLIPTITFLQGAYGLERPADLLMPTDDPYKAEIRDQLLSTNGMKWLHHLETYVKDRPYEEFTKEIGERDKMVQRVWMRDIVLRATSIDDPELADSYIYAASCSNYQKELVVDIVQKIEVLGPAKLATLREFAGIYALSDYSLDQLERMVRVADGDPAELAHLGLHDVTVLISNKMGDYNSVLSRDPEMVDDERKRVLFFEMQSAVDVYRIFQKLAAKGIKPSTLLIAAHGSKGSFSIDRKPAQNSNDRFSDIPVIDTRDFVEEINNTLGLSAGYQAHALHGMKGFARLVEDYMAPSKGVDDDAQNIGGKKIAFITCSAAGERKIADKDPKTGENVEVDSASIVSQLAADLAKSGVSTEVEIYGADDSIQSHPSPRGFHYSVLQQGEGDRTKHGAVLVTVYGNTTTKEEVDEIPLRNFDRLQSA